MSGTSVTLYGIRNCDTMKKARAWLEAHDVPYVFHDYRTDGLAPARLAQWVDELGWESLVNRKGTTFRRLPPTARAHIDAGTATALMLAQPSLIKRPVLDLGTRRIVGFTPASYEQIFASRGR